MKKLLVFVVLLAVGVGAAYHFGLLSRLGVRVRFIPKDPALLAYFGPDTRELLVVHSTELDMPLDTKTQEELDRQVKDVHAKTGVDTREDLDSLAVTTGLAVARGRFDWARLSTYLQSEGYTLTELEGVPTAVKAQAADVALDGHYLLVGPQNLVSQALALKRQGGGLGDDSPLVKALDTIGWKHGMVGGLVSGSRLPDLMGKTGMLQSLLGAFDVTPEGLDLHGTALTGGEKQGQALLKLLELGRSVLLLTTGMETAEEQRLLADALRKSELKADAQGVVTGHIRFPHALVDATSASYAQADFSGHFQKLNQAAADEEDSPSAVRPPAPRPSVVSPPVTTGVRAAPGPVDWKPPVLGLFLLVIVLVTMGAQSRPGMFNVLFHPLYLLPFAVATMGVVVFRWTGHAGGVFDVLVRPMPEWHRLVSYPLAQPVALSAAVPLVFAVLSGVMPWLRRFAAGLGVGFSAWLAVEAFSHPPLALIPPAYTQYWYAGNALMALVLARLALPPRQAARSTRRP
ncbi:DUF5942 domain-containing protein [Archangium primigenium]|uniref:DUF5942 domain-containing protein n=1 Tax=[Archangium] primigenium TaxID=2792470 RepID=UPI001959D616|nr:DUF5942 domain-containing protein [Archangium primigenium]MBM7116018.1 hypothetical protein [Archangium primigenium]